MTEHVRTSSPERWLYAGDSLAVVGMAGLFDALRNGLVLLELALLVAGLSPLADGVTLAVLSLRARTTRFVVDVAGEGANGHPLSGDTPDAASLDRLRTALTRE